ncbi:Nuclear receptor coactivator 7 [Eumeta japonica]|uniref:Nuclear receptor coactivator 7 n=1 Tax=Eumeta variegata TaxID=151549 RepID=A0A4C1W652_EUMVA|nr:Nuclear receptor coactivator 7 [Eumeta japonica]
MASGDSAARDRSRPFPDGDKDSDGRSESGDNTSESTQGPPSEPPQEKEILDNLRPVSPEVPASTSSTQRFLKINVRHITDGQAGHAIAPLTFKFQACLITISKRTMNHRGSTLVFVAVLSARLAGSPQQNSTISSLTRVTVESHLHFPRERLKVSPSTINKIFCSVEVFVHSGVVSGVLLVTPNAVMFDPNVSDTLVMEHGPESYGVIAPMEYVVNTAIFYDIAHMRTHGPDHNTQKAEQAEIYYMNKAEHSPGKDSLLVKDETFPELQAATSEGVDGGEEGGERPDSGDPDERAGAAFPKAFDRELVTPTALQQSTEERRKSLLDHHWAIPSKDRMSIDQGSEVSSSADNVKDESIDGSMGATAERAESADTADVGDEGGDGDAQHLVKLSYHDSGIDIRDPVPNITTNTNNKKDFVHHDIETIYESPESEQELDSSLFEFWDIEFVYEKGFLCFGVEQHGVHEDFHSDMEEVYSDADIVLSTDWVPPVCIPRTDPPLSAPPLGASEERAPRKHTAVSFSLDGNQQIKDEQGKPDKKNKMLKRLSYPLSWVEGLTGEGGGAGAGTGTGSQAESLPTSADSHNSTSVFSKVFNSSPMNLVEFGTGLFLSKTPSEEAPLDVFPQSGRSSLGGFGRPHTKSTSSSGSTQPRLDYRSMVSVDDMPDLFASFDKLIPRPARPSDDPPLYLRLRMGKPAGRPLPRTTPLMSYGRKRMKPEYWFGIPRNRVDDLYKFLTLWVPDRYGPLGDVSAQGYELIDSDTEWDDEDGKPGQKGERSGSTGDVSNLTRESWELLKAPYVKIYSIMKSHAEALGDSLGEEPRPEVRPTRTLKWHGLALPFLLYKFLIAFDIASRTQI